MEAILKKEIVVNKTFCRTIGVFVFVILTALGAFVRIPLTFTPVPVTLQTFFVLLSGAFLGSALGSLSQASYLVLGILGLPIFTGAGSGLLYLFGPTGGYLLGFVFASFFVGRFIRYGKNLFWVFCILVFADFILLALGVFWLKFLFSYPWSKILLMGFLPFLPGDLFKAGVASFIYLKLKSRLKEIF
ncbi:MAG: biotin transporter BioY [Candidatus Omnitrophica bacterium]|nr:biotin transporter BioY [Candidatus Omnitrophota bacterium]